MNQENRENQEDNPVVQIELSEREVLMAGKGFNQLLREKGIDLRRDFQVAEDKLNRRILVRQKEPNPPPPVPMTEESRRGFLAI